MKAMIFIGPPHLLQTKGSTSGRLDAGEACEFTARFRQAVVEGCFRQRLQQRIDHANLCPAEADASGRRPAEFQQDSVPAQPLFRQQAHGAVTQSESLGVRPSNHDSRGSRAQGVDNAGMAKTFRPYEPDQMLLMPPSLADWVWLAPPTYFAEHVMPKLA
jgi:hypothetical protein